MKTSQIPNLLLSILSALLLSLSFPKHDLWILSWVGLLPLFFLFRVSNLRQIFLWYWFSGTLFFLLTIYWVVETMNNYGGLPIWLSLLVLLILALYLGLFFGVFGLLTGWILSKSAIPLPFAAPLVWVSFEYIRTYLLTGFPWAALGYSQYKFLKVIQIADITSYLGISFLIVGINAGIFEIIKTLRGRQWVPPLSSAISICSISLLFIASIAYGHYTLQTSISDEDLQGSRVAVLQGNIPQHLKWDRSFQENTISIYKNLTEEAVRDDAQIVIWPETAAPFFFQEPTQYRMELLELAKNSNIHLLIGSPSFRISDGPSPDLLNSAYLVSPQGNTPARYDKIHLVPFGEYVPLSRILFFIEKMVTGIGDFVPGNEHTVFETPHGRFGVVICFEVIFPDLVRRFVLSGAEFMTTITNDAWFGRSSAPYQHFSMTVFRAIENRVFFARAANTGISGFISPKGEILEASPIFEKGKIVQTLYPSTEKSFYARNGDIFAYICIAMTILLLFYTAWREINSPP